MKQGVKITTPRYQQIAVDIAAKIVEGNYKEGDKVYARSSVASQYGVSPETARRAICVLSDLGIVDTVLGSGVVIKSYDAAVRFISRHNSTQTILDLKQELVDSVQRQTNELQLFNECLDKLIDKTERFRTFNPLIPFQIQLNASSKLLNKTISDVNFWHSTSATIVAIRRGDQLLVSPGPYAVFCEGDIVFFIGDELCNDKVKSFAYSL